MLWFIVVEVLVTIVVAAVVAVVVMSRIETSVWLLRRRLGFSGDVGTVGLVSDFICLVSYTLSRKSTVSI